MWRPLGAENRWMGSKEVLQRHEKLTFTDVEACKGRGRGVSKDNIKRCHNSGVVGQVKPFTRWDFKEQFIVTFESATPSSDADTTTLKSSRFILQETLG